MELAEREYHETLATEINRTQLIIRHGEQSLVRYRWMAGKRINAVYGDSNIPFLDLEELTTIYGVRASVINHCRKLAAKTTDEQDALTVADEYENWTGVVRGFLAGYSPKTTKSITNGEKAREKSRRHVSHVADYVRDELINVHGMTLNDVGSAIELFVRAHGASEIAAMWSQREQLRAWHEMKVSLASRGLFAGQVSTPGQRVCRY